MNARWSVAVFALCSLAGYGCIPQGTVVSGAAAESTADGKKCPPAEGMIDDAEDNNNQITAVKGRGGYWYTFGDKAGTTITPALGGTFAMSPGGAAGSANAAHINGKVGTAAIVYAGLGLNFVDPKGAYNASAYKGISFWAKVGPGSATKVRLKIPSVDTDPDGKVCTECFNDMGVDLDFTTTWAKYTVPFNSTSQLAGWGAPHVASLETSKIYGLQWQINTPGADYDLWIDDVEFTGCP